MFQWSSAVYWAVLKSSLGSARLGNCRKDSKGQRAQELQGGIKPSKQQPVLAARGCVILDSASLGKMIVLDSEYLDPASARLRVNT